MRVTTVANGSQVAVASRRPPSPHSTTATSTPSSAKARNAHGRERLARPFQAGPHAEALQRVQALERAAVAIAHARSVARQGTPAAVRTIRLRGRQCDRIAGRRLGGLGGGGRTRRTPFV